MPSSQVLRTSIFRCCSTRRHHTCALIRQRLSAIVATFAPRSTVIPAEVPDGHSDAFATDPGKQRQWDAFARNLSGAIPGFGLVISELRQGLTGCLAVT